MIATPTPRPGDYVTALRDARPFLPLYGRITKKEESNGCTLYYLRCPKTEATIIVPDEGSRFLIHRRPLRCRSAFSPLPEPRILLHPEPIEEKHSCL